MNRLPIILGCLGVLAGSSLAVTSQLGTPKPAPDTTKKIDFQRDIQPIFAARCYKCHGPDKQQAGLRLDQRAAALAGGDSARCLFRARALPVACSKWWPGSTARRRCRRLVSR